MSWHHSTHHVAHGAVAASLCPVFAELREDKEGITDIVVEDEGGEDGTTKIREDAVEYLKHKNESSGLIKTELQE